MNKLLLGHCVRSFRLLHSPTVGMPPANDESGDQMKKMWSVGLAMVGIAAGGFVGCEVGSPDTAIREVGIIIAGFYANPNGNLVSQNSGQAIVSLSITQSGDQIEGVDNNGQIFRGTIGSASDTAATITLNGRTTAGASGIIQATVNTSGTTATMQGTWAEATLYGTVYGQATVPTNSSSGGETSTGTVSSVSTRLFPATAGVEAGRTQLIPPPVRWPVAKS